MAKCSPVHFQILLHVGTYEIAGEKSFAYQITPFQTAHGQNCSSPGGWGDSMWFPRSL